jgi:hypothetical protein
MWYKNKHYLTQGAEAIMLPDYLNAVTWYTYSLATQPVDFHPKLPVFLLHMLFDNNYTFEKHSNFFS